MNASDIVKAKQDRTLYQAYYRPTIFPGNTVSTVNICPVSSVSTGTTTYESTTTILYNYVCYPPSVSYELSNAVNNGKYICGCNNDEGISIWNTGQIIPTNTADCKISFLQWKNTNVTPVYSFKVNNYSSISTFSTTTMTGPGPVICPLVDYYQGTNFDNRCNTCNAALYDTTNGNC